MIRNCYTNKIQYLNKLHIFILYNLFMKYLFPLFFILLFNSITAQINTFIPDWVKPIDAKSVGAVNKKQIKEGYYYSLFDEQYNVVKKHSYFH